MQRSSEAVQHGSFASIPPVCRQREQGKESIFSHTSLPETSITTCLARRPRAPRHRLVRAGACSATARAKSAVVFGGPGDFAIISRALPPPLSLLNLLPPFRAPSLLSQSTAFCQRPPGDPQIPAHAHTHTHRPGKVFSSCEITLTTGHSRYTLVVVVLPLRRHHLPRTMQASRDRDAMPVATSLVSRQCTVQHTIHSTPARFCHLYRLHGLARVSHKTT